MTLEQKLEIKIRDEDSQIFRDATQVINAHVRMSMLLDIKYINL